MERNVVVAGWGQITQPRILNGKRRDPLALMAEAARRAADQMAAREILTHLDAIMVVRTLSHHYPSPARQLADLLNAAPRLAHVSGIGGNSPQTLINMAAAMIACSQMDSVLITGAEAYVRPDDTHKKIESALFRGIPEDYPGDDRIGTTCLENQHGIEHPMQGFPLFETALWAESGLDLGQYMQKIAGMWSRFSQTAAENPYAWSRTAKTPEEIVTPSPANRLVAFPYTKYMNSFVTVDQGAAVILMSESTAKKYRQKSRQTVYFCGGGYAEDRQRFMIEKSDFTASPPLKSAVDKALECAGMQLETLDCFDLYSCFPCAVTIAKKMLNIAGDDPRPLTLTGGLGFFGGPGNNYNLHGVATLAEKISLGIYSNGMTTALGWFMHKHAAGIYGTAPPKNAFNRHNRMDPEKCLAGDLPVPVKPQVNGYGSIETYTVIYSRDQKPSYAVLYGKTEDDFRFIARTRDDPEIFHWLKAGSRVGHRVKIVFDDSLEMNIADFL